MADIDAIKKKIAKLLAMANDSGASEAEAQMAFEKAQEYLAEYNLNAEDVTNDLEHEDITDEAFTEQVRETWQITLRTATARLYFCKYYYSTGVLDENYKKATEHNYVGRPHNIAVAKSMASYLINTIKRLGEEHVLPIPGDKRTISGIRRNFELGCASKVTARINEKYREIERQDPGDYQITGTKHNLPALYKSELQLCNDHLKNQGVHLRSATTKRNVTNGAAYQRGRAAGENVSLNTQLNKSSSRYMLGNG
jgi:hypothetical protein